jgi:hypothetical protein
LSFYQSFFISLLFPILPHSHAETQALSHELPRLAATLKDKQARNIHIHDIETPKIPDVDLVFDKLSLYTVFLDQVPPDIRSDIGRSLYRDAYRVFFYPACLFFFQKALPPGQTLLEWFCL